LESCNEESVSEENDDVETENNDGHEYVELRILQNLQNTSFVKKEIWKTWCCQSYTTINWLTRTEGKRWGDWTQKFGRIQIYRVQQKTWQFLCWNEKCTMFLR